MQARSHETRVAFRQEGAALVLQRMYRTAAYWHEARIYIQMQTRRRNMRVISVAKRWQVSRARTHSDTHEYHYQPV